jgi:hypothetical protein
MQQVALEETGLQIISMFQYELVHCSAAPAGESASTTNLRL